MTADGRGCAIRGASHAGLSVSRAASSPTAQVGAASSTPQDSRTRSAGTAASEPSTEPCVIACGTSISDSTPPSDSASVKTCVRVQIARASGWRNETMPE